MLQELYANPSASWIVLVIWQIQAIGLS